MSEGLERQALPGVGSPTLLADPPRTLRPVYGGGLCLHLPNRVAAVQFSGPSGSGAAGVATATCHSFFAPARAQASDL